jgi:SSS family transporter
MNPTFHQFVLGSSSIGLSAMDYGVMLLYLVAVVAVGWHFTEKGDDTESYLLGGRGMGWMVIGISYTVSLLSTLSLVAIPGEAYNHGLILILQSLLAPVFAVVTFFIFIRFYFKTKMFTPFQYLESRFDSRVRGVAAMIYWGTRLFYLALVLYASSKVFEGASGWAPEVTIVVVGVVGIAYTAMGGLRAVVWTDVIQFFILALGLGLVFFMASGHVPGGFVGAIQFAFENGRGMEELGQASFYTFNPFERIGLWILVIAVFSEFLFYNSADQIAIQRLLSTSGYKQAKRSLFTYILISLPVTAVLWILGLVMFSFYSHQTSGPMPTSGDLALFNFIGTHMPSPLPGIILAAMLAAVMSTLDSGLNSLATVATKDFYLRMFRPGAGEDAQVRFSRRMTIATGLFAILAGLLVAQVSGSIGETVIEASSVWMCFASVLAPTFLLGVTTRSLNGKQAMIALTSGWVALIPMIGWYLYSKHREDIPDLSFMYVSLPGIVAPLVVGYGMAIFSKPRSGPQIDDLTLWTLSEEKDCRPDHVPD